MHAQVRIGNSMVMMGGAMPDWPAMPAGLYLYVDEADETYARAIDAGATSVMPPTDEFWGDRMGGVSDRGATSGGSPPTSKTWRPRRSPSAPRRRCAKTSNRACSAWMPGRWRDLARARRTALAAQMVVEALEGGACGRDGLLFLVAPEGPARRAGRRSGARPARRHRRRRRRSAAATSAACRAGCARSAGRPARRPPERSGSRSPARTSRSRESPDSPGRAAISASVHPRRARSAISRSVCPGRGTPSAGQSAGRGQRVLDRAVEGQLGEQQAPVPVEVERAGGEGGQPRVALDVVVQRHRRLPETLRAAARRRFRSSRRSVAHRHRHVAPDPAPDRHAWPITSGWPPPVLAASTAW